MKELAEEIGKRYHVRDRESHKSRRNLGPGLRFVRFSITTAIRPPNGVCDFTYQSCVKATATWQSHGRRRRSNNRSNNRGQAFDSSIWIFRSNP